MDAGSAAERQREELRAEVETLRALIKVALDSDCDRAIIVSAAKMLRETQRLQELESPGWIE